MFYSHVSQTSDAEKHSNELLLSKNEVGGAYTGTLLLADALGHAH